LFQDAKVTINYMLNSKNNTVILSLQELVQGAEIKTIRILFS